MNQGRIWCVVNPTVGLPLFLGGVATIALLVHASVMSHTTWMSGYWQGGGHAKVADASKPESSTLPTSNSPAYAISVAPVSTLAGQGATSFVVTVSPTGSGAGPTRTLVADTRTSP